MNLFRWRSR